jgi:DNA-binding transcriptional ArsR family regulator
VDIEVTPMNALQPTVWRTCRMLANEVRLRCLKTVFEHPGITVGEVADRTGMFPEHASQCLRALQARGLIRASRRSRWVSYDAVPDHLVPSAAPVLSAMREALFEKRVPEPDLIKTLTAFTHPRRLSILILLSKRGPATPETLGAAAGISQPAMSRHLSKLKSRGLIHSDNGKWSIIPCQSQPGKALLVLLHPA